MVVINLEKGEIKTLLKARHSLISNPNETFKEHSANEKKFADVAKKYGVSSQVVWDKIYEISKQK